jgi:predicted CXXCH cytochrome family protein
MNRLARTITLLLCISGVLSGTRLNAQTGIVNTKHNLSVSGPGLIKATSEDRICVFCHTPHNASPQSPLWNKKLEARNYALYYSVTMKNPASLPTGPSRLCLSCHDGILALGDVKVSGKFDITGNPIPISMQNVGATGGIPGTSSSYLGLSLAGDHPFSFSYFGSLPNPELSPVLPAGLVFYGDGTVHCTTCHDPHDNTNKKFLVVDNMNSGLCTRCHTMNGWTGSPHNLAQSTWNGTAPNPWPRTGSGTDFGWTDVQKNGCENCHSPHKAIGEKRLLNCYTELGPCNPFAEEGVCLPCHNGNMIPPVKNIFNQLTNASRHAVDLYSGLHDPKESPRLLNHVECVDCHNSHVANNIRTASAPLVSGRLEGISGVTIDDTVVRPAVNEYEICFKCHASYSAQSVFPPIPRYVNNANMQWKFKTNNPSFHPVTGLGASKDVPSLYLPLTTSSMIYCTDCHSDESVANGGTGSRGPHGSKYAPILRDKYDTTNNLHSYSTSNFMLCYNCHNESSILSDDTFQKRDLQWGGHSGHLAAITDANNVTHYVFASCSACHDPHGIPDDGMSGSHKRLINFDSRIVSALPGSGFNVPIFAGSGNRKGACALVCHDSNGNTAVHDGTTKFTYGGAAPIGPGTINIHW